MPPPDVCRIAINLNDGRAIRIELGPREVRAEQKQHIAVEYGVITGWSADDAGHSNIVRIVVLDEVLATGRVRHRRLEPRRRGDHLVMRCGAASARIDRNCLAFVENGGEFVEVGVAWANERAPVADAGGKLSSTRGSSRNDIRGPTDRVVIGRASIQIQFSEVAAAHGKRGS